VSKDHFTVAALSFALALGTACLLPACFGGDCNCPALPERPDAQSALPLQEAKSYGTDGNETLAPITPENGLVTVTPEQVVITYEQDGAAYEVTYDVMPAGLL